MISEALKRPEPQKFEGSLFVDGEHFTDGKIDLYQALAKGTFFPNDSMKVSTRIEKAVLKINGDYLVLHLKNLEPSKQQRNWSFEVSKD